MNNHILQIHIFITIPLFVMVSSGNYEMKIPFQKVILSIPGFQAPGMGDSRT